MKQIKLLDTTLRDGEQSPGCSMTIEQKVEIAKLLDEMNVDIIEAGFAASNKKDFEAIKRISKVCKNSIIASLARCRKDDIKLAYESIKEAKKKRIHIFLATSKIHRKYKLKKSKKEIKKLLVDGLQYAKTLCNDIEFTLEDATRTEKNFACEMINLAIQNGATTINIADTVGIMLPNELKEFIEYLMKHSNLRKASISVHCHNDLGMATANALTSLNCGIDQIECTINGIGERAGNTALEEVVATIQTKKKQLQVKTNINTKLIKKTSDKVIEYTNSRIQNNKAVVGKNAFLHEAGIHQQGILQKKSTYEILNPNEYGITPDRIQIGIHSGKNAIRKKMKDLNYNTNKYDIEKIMEEIKNYLESHKKISDDSFRMMIEKNSI